MPKRNSKSCVSVAIEISPGELLDRISILEIKRDRIKDPNKLENVRFELAHLRDAAARTLLPGAEIGPLTLQLKSINESLWDIEDEIRACEARRDFGTRFIALARSVYRDNDRRAALKKQINVLLGSGIVEEKSYTDYS